jgi:hypothetical protein
MAIPCPKHQAKAWVLYQRNHGPRVDWTREAEIARGCCPDCSDEAASLYPSEGSEK